MAASPAFTPLLPASSLESLLASAIFDEDSPEYFDPQKLQVAEEVRLAMQMGLPSPYAHEVAEKYYHYPADCGAALQVFQQEIERLDDLVGNQFTLCSKRLQQCYCATSSQGSEGGDFPRVFCSGTDELRDRAYSSLPTRTILRKVFRAISERADAESDSDGSSYASSHHRHHRHHHHHHHRHHSPSVRPHRSASPPRAHHQRSRSATLRTRPRGRAVSAPRLGATTRGASTRGATAVRGRLSRGPEMPPPGPAKEHRPTAPGKKKKKKKAAHRAGSKTLPQAAKARSSRG